MAEFDPDAYLKEKESEFDPDSYLAEKEAPKTQGPAATAMDRAADMVLFGHLPQAQAAVDTMSVSGDDYVKRRDELIKLLETERADNPEADMAGMGLGIAGSIAANPGSMLPGIKALPKVVQAGLAALEGLGMMAAQNPGDQPGVVDPLQLQDRKALVTEHPGMAAAAVALPAISGLAQMNKGDKAAEMAFNAIEPSKRVRKEAIRAGEQSAKSQESVGRFALDKGIVSPSSNYEKMYDRSSEILKKVGTEISQVVGRTNEKVGADLLSKALRGTSDKAKNEFLSKTFARDNVKEKILGEIANTLEYKPGSEAAIAKADAYLESIWKKKVPDLEELQKMRTRLGESVRDWGKSMTETPEVQQAWRIIRNHVDDAIDAEFDYAEKIAATGDKSRIKQLRKDYTSAKVINDASLNKMSSSSGTSPAMNALNIAGMAAAGGMAANQNIPQAAGTAAGILGLNLGAKFLGDGRGKSMAASAADALGNNPMGRGMMAPSNVAAQVNRMTHDQTIEGFPMSMTDSVYNASQRMGIPPDVAEQTIRAEIQKNPQFSNIEKANRLQLLNKHGRVYLGQ